MNDLDIRCFCGVIFIFSLYQNFPCGRLRSPENSGQKLGKWAYLAASGFFGSLVVGSSGFINITLVLGFAGIGVLFLVFTKARYATTGKRHLELFIAGQTMMIMVLYASWKAALPLEVHSWYRSFEQLILVDPSPVTAWLRQNLEKILILLSVYLFMIEGGTQFVRGFLNKFGQLTEKALHIPEEQNNGGFDRGKWIGILERFITLTFVLTNHYDAIAFALAAKSLARFKELETNRAFAEYYLLGTSASLVVAIFAGIIVKSILGI